MATGTQHHKRGPVAKPGRVRVTVYLDEALADWGKQQEGGLSDLMRRLLSNARDREGDLSDPYPVELQAAYQRLIDRKLRSGLTPVEEGELADVRERINLADRTAAAWRERERAASAASEGLKSLAAKGKRPPDAW